jgi:hypothetical protein
LTNGVIGVGLITLKYTPSYDWNKWLKLPSRTIQFEWKFPGSQARLFRGDLVVGDQLNWHVKVQPTTGGTAGAGAPVCSRLSLAQRPAAEALAS